MSNSRFITCQNKSLAIIGMAICVLLNFNSHAFSGEKAAPKKPNIIIIMADDMGFSDLGSFGGEIHTPNLDALANNGLRFTNFYNAARCWPTRTSLLTGFYERTVSSQPVTGKFGFQPWVPLLPHYLKPQGYRSYMAGKLHVIGADDAVAAGFDHSYFTKKVGSYYTPKMIIEDGKVIPSPDPTSGYHLTDVIGDKMLAYLDDHHKNHNDKPFFLYGAHMAPHWPLEAHQHDIDKYKDKYDAGWDALRKQRNKRLKALNIIDADLYPMEPKVDVHPENPARWGKDEVYKASPWRSLSQSQKDFQSDKFAIHAALVEHLDRNIGRVIKKLKEIGEYENTIIFFNSDNGASSEIYTKMPHDKTLPMGSWGTYLGIGPAWSTASNTPFRRHKAHVYEGGIATPLIVHWPAGIKQPGLRHEPAHVIDYIPTLVDLTGGKALKQHKNQDIPIKLPGKSLVPTFSRETSLDRELLFFEHQGGEALRMGDWKIVHGKKEPWQLFNLKDDRTETTNLADKYPQRLQQMIKRINAYKDDINLWK